LTSQRLYNKNSILGGIILIKQLILDGNSLTINTLVKTGRDSSVRVAIKEENWQKITECRELCERFAKEERVIYGVNTSCGGLVDHLLPQNVVREFQQNLIKSVTTQVGEFLPDEIVRMAMIARCNALCRGYSGIKPTNLKIYIEMINKNIFPCIPKQGSLGASGDLGPLGCIACVAIGEWKARYKGKIMPGREAMDLAGIPLMVLDSKEGLSLINGTSCMAALASSVIFDAINTVFNTDIISALSVETLMGRINPFDLRVHDKKYHPGQYATAYNMMALLNDSLLTIDEQKLSQTLSSVLKGNSDVIINDIPLEDAYSLRCIPQVIGPVRESLEFTQNILERELNSSNDNPLLFTEYETFIHNGHFHGQYISLAMDFVAIAITTVSVISDRRVDRFMDKNSSVGLPPFLCKERTGIRMGLMGGQFMTSSLVAENRTLVIPASVQSISSTANFQDVVSFGLIAARKARSIIDNTNYVLAFELMCAAQAADIRGTKKLSSAGKILHKEVRKIVPYLNRDEVIIDYLEALHNEIKNGTFVEAVETAVGKLQFTHSRTA